jgi:hypothetical protein
MVTEIFMIIVHLVVVQCHLWQDLVLLCHQHLIRLFLLHTDENHQEKNDQAVLFKIDRRGRTPYSCPTIGSALLELGALSDSFLTGGLRLTVSWFDLIATGRLIDIDLL